jgi:hypothetical protein
MPIPGLVTSRRQPRPKKKAVPEPVFNPKAAIREMKAAAAAAEIVAKQRKEMKERERERRSTKRRSRSRRRDRSASSSRSSAAEGDVDPKEAWKERQEREKEEEEERVRKETDERFRAAQLEREVRQREEVRLAEERRLKDEQRHAERKKKLKGAFATGESDDEDEDHKRRRELAERAKKQTRSEALSAAAVSLVPLQRPPGSEALAVGLADLETPSRSASGGADAVSIRAQLADPSASRNFSPGEVAEKYKLLQEMKRKFRRSEFGGGAAEPKEKARHRSRSRERSKRSASRSRYDSVWIKPPSSK